METRQGLTWDSVSADTPIKDMASLKYLITVLIGLVVFAGKGLPIIVHSDPLSTSQRDALPVGGGVKEENKKPADEKKSGKRANGTQSEPLAPFIPSEKVRAG